MPEKITKLRGQHCLNIFVSYQLKERIMKLAGKYDRTMADMVRTLIRVGIPVLEGLNEAEERMLKDSVSLAKRMRKIKQMKVEPEGYDDRQFRSEL
jgi:predicted DNA-binding protein